EHAVPHPEVHRVPAACRLRLRRLVLVVREDEVHAPAVEIEGLAQPLPRHGRALDVPSRPPGTPRGLPVRLARLGALPEGEVERALLVLARLDPRAAPEVVDLPPGDAPVLRVAGDVEVDVAAGGVGGAALDEARDEFLDLGNVLGGPRMHRCALDVE